MLRVALIALVHRVAGTTINLSQDWVVATDANAEAALDAVVEDEAVRGLHVLEELYFVDPANDNTGAAEEAGEVPTALPCFGSSSSGDTPSSPCPEPRSRNLRGRRH